MGGKELQAKGEETWGRTLTTRETTEGGTSRWRKLIEARGRLNLSLLSLFGLVGVKKKERETAVWCSTVQTERRRTGGGGLPVHLGTCAECRWSDAGELTDMEGKTVREG